MINRSFIKSHAFIPFTALIFIILIYGLIYLDLIPTQLEIITILKSIYNEHGPMILFVSVFLESIVYLGLYFPGSFIAFLIVMFSNGSFFEFFIIFVLSLLALFFGNVVNYSLGLFMSQKQNLKYRKTTKKHFLVYILHPNLIAFHMFRCGIFKKNFHHIFILMFLFMPYLIFLIALVFLFEQTGDFVSSYYTVPSLLLLWLLFAMFLDYKEKPVLDSDEEWNDL